MKTWGNRMRPLRLGALSRSLVVLTEPEPEELSLEHVIGRAAMSDFQYQGRTDDGMRLEMPDEEEGL